MAFESYEELIKMASTNPKMASKYVSRAQRAGTPVVSSQNEGYSNKAGSSSITSDMRQNALKRQMRRASGVPSIQEDPLIKKRKEMGY